MCTADHWSYAEWFHANGSDFSSFNSILSYYINQFINVSFNLSCFDRYVKYTLYKKFVSKLSNSWFIALYFLKWCRTKVLQRICSIFQMIQTTYMYNKCFLLFLAIFSFALLFLVQSIYLLIYLYLYLTGNVFHTRTSSTKHCTESVFQKIVCYAIYNR